jgi:hypothetical protein
MLANAFQNDLLFRHALPGEPRGKEPLTALFLHTLNMELSLAKSIRSTDKDLLSGCHLGIVESLPGGLYVPECGLPP